MRFVTIALFALGVLWGSATPMNPTLPATFEVSQPAVTGSTISIAANRISYCFDLHGPSLATDTACSSSLTACHVACQSL